MQQPAPYGQMHQPNSHMLHQAPPPGQYQPGQAGPYAPQANHQLPPPHTAHYNQQPNAGLHQQYQPQAYAQHQLPQPAYGQPPASQAYGQQPPPTPYGQGPMPAYGQAPPQQQPQRLDPDAMPSVSQVIEEDYEKFHANSASNVIFSTSIPVQVPPLESTIEPDSIINDGGCARPQHLRATVYQIPATEDILKSTSIPLGIIIKPFDETEADGQIVVPISNSDIIRCNRCRAYMSPYMRFMDGGRRFQCALCHAISEVSQTYFGHLDHTGQRLDKYERPELCLGSYEFKATAEFCRNSILNCRRPHIVFAFEMTKNSISLIRRIATELPSIIREHLPVDPLRNHSTPPLVGFITYNSKITLHDVKNDGQAHVICDIGSAFPPMTSFLADPLLHSEKIEKFLLSLPSLYPVDELEQESILGPVIEAALLTTQFDTANWYTNESVTGAPNETVNGTSHAHSNVKDPEKSVPAGKVYLFHCTLPTYGPDGSVPGRLKPRWTTSPDEVRRLLGTDKEKQILSPESSNYYTTLGQRVAIEFGSGVELFLFPPPNGSYLDIATLSELVKLTGSGGIYKYYSEPGDSGIQRFLCDLKLSLRSSFAFEAVMKVRTSAGIRPFDYFGHYYSRVSSDVEVACVNAGNSMAVELRYDDKLSENEFAVIQVAILYTSVSGERRVRCHNMALPTCTTVADVFRSACCDSLMNLLVRQSIASMKSGEHSAQQIKEGLIQRTVKILTSYRRHCAQPGSSLGQLILPEALKLLPVYLTGALKCDAIDGGPEMAPDDKAFAQIRTLGANIRNLQAIIYPKLLRIEYEDEDESKLKSVQLRCSELRLNDPRGLVYILENTFYMFIYVPTVAAINGHGKFIKNVFNADSAAAVIPEAGLLQLGTRESQFINDLVQSIWKDRKKTTKIAIVRQGIDKIESVFKSFLYEDKKNHPPVPGEGGRHEAPSYVDLLCHLHKEIRHQLN